MPCGGAPLMACSAHLEASVAGDANKIPRVPAERLPATAQTGPPPWRRSVPKLGGNQLPITLMGLASQSPRLPTTDAFTLQTHQEEISLQTCRQRRR
jgi:hypothetical protein